jgi:putative endonuclease
MGFVAWWQGVLRGLRLTPQSLGQRGERYAGAYLRKHGMKIIARNRTLGGGLKGEIDLIGIEGDFLVFVEVRTRATDAFMTPEQSVRHDKRKAVLRTVRRLVRRHKTAGLTPRIDLVAIIWPDGAKAPTQVRHHRGIMRLERW